jgi:hypothetical protein
VQRRAIAVVIIVIPVVRLWRHGRRADRVGHIAAPAAPVAVCPARAPPNALPQVGHLGQQAMDPAPARDRRWEGAQPRPRGRRALPVPPLDPRRLTGLPDKGPPPFGPLTTPPLLALLGEPDARQRHRYGRLGTMTIGTPAPQATENLLKRLPQGGGVAPPKRRQ